jgi:hypothetical protein
MASAPPNSGFWLLAPVPRNIFLEKRSQTLPVIIGFLEKTNRKKAVSTQNVAAQTFNLQPEPFHPLTFNLSQKLTGFTGTF